MKVNGKHYRTIWLSETDETVIKIIDQRFLPHKFIIEDLKTVDNVAIAIKEMHVRGAGLIGATAGYGMYLATLYLPIVMRDGWHLSILALLPLRFMLHLIKELMFTYG